METLVVYEARAESALTEAAIAAIRAGDIDAALHFSRRSAAIFLDLARAAGVAGDLAAIVHVCISGDAAVPLLDAGLPVRVAATPDSAGLFAALESV